jgi:hypothetical protein
MFFVPYLLLDFKIIYTCLARIEDCLMTRYLTHSISSSSGEYLVKYTMSHTFTSMGALVQLSKIFPSQTAITLPLLGFSFFSGKMIQDLVLFSSSIASTNMWSSNGSNFILCNIYDVKMNIVCHLN